MRACLALVICLLLCGAPASALVGADVADRTVQRFTVVVAGAKGRCSGVVLAPDIVLTAAHCVRRGERVHVGGNLGGGYHPAAVAAQSRRRDRSASALYAKAIPARPILRSSNWQNRCLTASSRPFSIRASRTSATT